MKHTGQAPYSMSVRLPADEKAAQALFADARELGVQRLRVELPTAHARDDAARDRYQRMLARAAESFAVVGAFCRSPQAAAAPVVAGDTAGYYAAVIRLANAVGAHCEWFELTDPLGPATWPDASAGSARLLRDLSEWIGTPVALGGLPLDPAWLSAAREAGLLEPFGALGFPDPAALFESGDPAARLAAIESLCDRQALWLTPAELGGPARGERSDRGLTRTADWLEAASARVFLPMTDLEHGAGALARRLLRRGGSAALRRVGEQATSARPESGYDLITGGAGFVGSNLALRLAQAGRPVVVLDSLSRPGTEENLEWLRGQFPQRIQFVLADIRDREAVAWASAGAERVFHLAAQVAVTTSLADPHEDHAVNATGTLNLLEALRRRETPPPLLMTSTNKVYGGLGEISLRRAPAGYEPVDDPVRGQGIDERTPLALASPYGCSKGAADQYVLDYAHSFGLPTAVFRMSCIYGPRQFGNEDQGWVAHFVRRTLRGEPITVYGDGHQVRDLLFVDDLVDALLTGMDRLPGIAGQAFNIGGGVDRATSLLGLLEQLERLHGELPPVHREDWRAGDQRYYVSDVERFRACTGWTPRVDIADGLRQLYEWMRAREEATDGVAARTADRRMAL